MGITSELAKESIRAEMERMKQYDLLKSKGYKQPEWYFRNLPAEQVRQLLKMYVK
jgi:hypothetical protein